MKTRKLGRTGLDVSPIALGGGSYGYVHKAANWDPYSEEGQSIAIATLNHAIDRGINYLDTAPLYGKGHSETLYGEVLKNRRKECVVATKVYFEEDRQSTIDSVRQSCERLQTNYIDIVQIHGRMYSNTEYDHVVKKGGPLDGLRSLRDAGTIGFIGLTTEEPWSAMQFLRHKEIDVYQIAYNLIYQAAARHFLIEAEKENVGVVTMRTMTSGVFQRLAHIIAPEWQQAHDLYDATLKFVLSDSRVHSGIVGMRWREEVDRNVKIAEDWEPPYDLAKLPRITFAIYAAEDSEIG
jgi:aryl-alcohol dehydrogenase-like predicted oxidoreductase